MSGEMQSLPKLFPVELSVEEKDEEVDVDLGTIEHLHDCHTVILQLQEIL